MCPELCFSAFVGGRGCFKAVLRSNRMSETCCQTHEFAKHHADLIVVCSLRRNDVMGKHQNERNDIKNDVVGFLSHNDLGAELVEGALKVCSRVFCC